MSNKKTERLDARSDAAQSPFALPPARQKPAIRKPERSALLARVSDFLPRMRAANNELEAELARDPTAQRKYDIEALDDDAPHVQMDLVRARLPHVWLALRAQLQANFCATGLCGRR